MKKIFLLALSIIVSQFSVAQSIDSKDYLTDVTKDIITTLENGEDQDPTVSFVVPKKSEIEYTEFLEKQFEHNNTEHIHLSVKDIEDFTPVVTVNNSGKSIMKLKNEAMPMSQTDGTHVFYAGTDKMISSQNALVGVRVAIISINKK
ncbi:MULTISPECIES: hypothetical protein [unclassified Flammeovirga]|uniref:hypothetical protein n=1 Tax=unclassified Flammeovirga TaxID=2637820 RepID=UPI0005C49F12|nr:MULTISPECIES: hypothetical protein [unclassified Flammeovirga]MBD0401282.1 hypothetical protein [Flammeovirga sp. EKP202]